MAGEQENITLDQIACRLLEDNFLLTALELHLELIEAGRELTRFKEFFSNPANFERQSAPPNATSIARSQSQATLDSLDISRFSEDGADEKVAVLEFELRKAKETISGLRATLTQMTAEQEDHVTSENTDFANDAVRPHEQRALNFLVNEYLLRQGYKLTAVTFSEENNDQDFDDWDDVGLNIPRPPELPQIYRVTHKETSEVECQTEEMFVSNDAHQRLMNQYNVLEENIEEDRTRFKLEALALSRKIEVELVEVSTDTEDLKINESEEVKTESTSTSPLCPPQFLPEFVEEPEECRKLPPKFERNLYEVLDLTNLAPQVSPDLINLLVETLQTVVSSKKEESIPLIVAAATTANNPEHISTLVNLLFNLRKKPQVNERRAIIEGVKQLATVTETLEAHLLPQTWELAGQKAAERRLLAAEVCLALAPVCPGRLRQAMILPMLQQLLLESTEPEIKCSVVKALALIVAHTSQEDKYLQCEELSFLVLEDQDNTVRQLAQQILLPVLAQWALEINRLESHLVKRLLTRLNSLAHDPRCGSLVETMSHLMPFILMHLALHQGVLKHITHLEEYEGHSIGQGLSRPEIFLGAGEHSASELMAALERRLNDDSYQDWPQMDWMLSVFLPGLFEALSSVESINEEAVLSYVKFYHQLCKVMGHHFSINRIKPMFKEGLRQVEDSIANMEDNAKPCNFPSLVLIPVLLVAILTTGDPNDTMELSTTLRHLLILLPSLKLPSTPLKVSTFHLCRAVALQDTVLACLSEACKNSRPAVRLTAAQLTLHCLSSIHDGALTKFILPQLAMLATDINEEVKEVAVTIYGELAAEQGVAQSPSRTALQALLKEAMTSHVMSVAVTRALARILPSSDPAFAEDVVLPQLCQLAAFCLHGVSSQTRRMDLGQALVAALSIALQVPLSKQAIAATLVPALRDLSVVCEQCMQGHYDAVNNWLREAETRAQIESTLPTTPKTEKIEDLMNMWTRPHLVQSAMSSATAAGRRSVEDVKQKMTSLLRKK